MRSSQITVWHIFDTTAAQATKSRIPEPTKPRIDPPLYSAVETSPPQSLCWCLQRHCFLNTYHTAPAAVQCVDPVWNVVAFSLF